MSVVERTRAGGSGEGGEPGPEGQRGFVGGEADTWKFIKPTTTPTAKHLSYNAANSATTTAIYVNETDNTGNFAGAFLNDLTAGDRIQILSPVTAGLYDLFEFQSALTVGEVRKLKVAFITSSTGSPPYADETLITFTMAHRGEKGEKGEMGPATLTAKEPPLEIKAGEITVKAKGIADGMLEKEYALLSGRPAGQKLDGGSVLGTKLTLRTNPFAGSPTSMVFDDTEGVEIFKGVNYGILHVAQVQNLEQITASGLVEGNTLKTTGLATLGGAVSIGADPGPWIPKFGYAVGSRVEDPATSGLFYINIKAYTAKEYGEFEKGEKVGGTPLTSNATFWTASTFSFTEKVIETFKPKGALELLNAEKENTFISGMEISPAPYLVFMANIGSQTVWLAADELAAKKKGKVNIAAKTITELPDVAELYVGQKVVAIGEISGINTLKGTARIAEIASPTSIKLNNTPLKEENAECTFSAGTELTSNRFRLDLGKNQEIPPNSITGLIYDTGTKRWRNFTDYKGETGTGGLFSALTVEETSTLEGALKTNGAATLEGEATVGKKLKVKEAATLEGELKGEAAVFGKTVKVKETLTAEGALKVAGESKLEGAIVGTKTLKVGEATTLEGELKAKAIEGTSGNFTTTLKAKETATFEGAATVGKTLKVAEEAKFEGAVAAANLTVKFGSTLEGELNGAAASLSKTLKVGEAATFEGAVVHAASTQNTSGNKTLVAESNDLELIRKTAFRLKTAAGATKLSGMFLEGLAEGGDSGQVVEIWNIGPSTLELLHESTASKEKNRFILPGAASVILPINTGYRFWYDATQKRWRGNNRAFGVFDTLTVKEEAKLEGAVVASKTLKVGEGSTLEGAVEATKTLKVGEESKLEGAATVGKTLVVKETLTVQDNALFEKTLKVNEELKASGGIRSSLGGIIEGGLFTAKEGLTVEGALTLPSESVKQNAIQGSLTSMHTPVRELAQF